MIEYYFKTRDNAAKLELDVSRKKNIKKKIIKEQTTINDIYLQTKI